MGKRIIPQRRGRGGSNWQAPPKGRFADTAYPFFPLEEKHTGLVRDVLHERGRSAPIAEIEFDNGQVCYLPAVEGLKVGQSVEIGAGAKPTPGNILPLEQIPEGTNICNIETFYGDGGKLIRASGTSALLFSLTPTGAVVRLPSGKTKIMNLKCRATIGIIAGGGRVEKPFLKAGTKWHLMKAKGKAYPRVRGVAMAAPFHPFGGGRHQHPGKSTSTHRDAPPGRKVGHIAPRKTGRKKIRRVR